MIMLDSIAQFNNSYGMILSVVFLLLYCFVQHRANSVLSKALEEERNKSKYFEKLYNSMLHDSEGESADE